MLTHIDLFSGVGGFALAAEWAGFETVLFCEKKKFGQKVLKKRFGAFVHPGGPGLEIRKGVEKDYEPESETAQRRNRIPLVPDIRNVDGKQFRGAVLLTGGFPCQPFSAAGRRRGAKDDRFLWPEMLRVIKEARPAWVIAENVDGLASMGEQIGDIHVESRTIVRNEDDDFFQGIYTRQEKMLLDSFCEDLKEIGYEVQPVIIPASAVGAPHRRYRVWIIASDSNPEIGGFEKLGLSIRSGKSRKAEGDFERGCQNDPNSKERGFRCGAASRKCGFDACRNQDDFNASVGGQAGNGRRGPGPKSSGRHSGYAPGSKDGENDSRKRGNLETEKKGGPGFDSASIAGDKHSPDAEYSRLDSAAIKGKLRKIKAGKETRVRKSSGTASDAPDADELFDWAWIAGEIGRGKFTDKNQEIEFAKKLWEIPWIKTATRFCRNSNGIPAWIYRHRTERLEALGNAIVPQVAFEIIRIIAEIENRAIF